MSTEKKQMYHLIPPYQCRLCRQDMLFFKMRNGNMVDYIQLIRRGMNLQQVVDFLTLHGVKNMRCMCCQKNFIIDWTHGWPVQVLNPADILKFMQIGPKNARGVYVC